MRKAPVAMDDFHYPGKELSLFAGAKNWKRYWSAEIRPHIKGRVLDVGAGIGSNFKYLCHSGVTEWCFLEPDEWLLTEIENKPPSHRVAFSFHHGTVATLSPLKRFDTIIYIDVLEHIQDDRSELEQATRHLETNGNLIVLSPAQPILFSNFDQSVGHFRRYIRRSLAQVVPEHLEPVRLDYLDCVGLLASLANRYLLKQTLPDLRQILFWDRMMVPLSRLIDPLCGHQFGKSILGVWRKTS